MLRANVQVVKWLHTTGLCKASLAMLDDVAGKGRLDAVIWLHERGARASERAVDLAAEAGHLEVVKFLMEHREEVGLGLSLPFACIVALDRSPSPLCPPPPQLGALTAIGVTYHYLTRRDSKILLSQQNLSVLTAAPVTFECDI